MELECKVQNYAWGKVGNSSKVSQLKYGNSECPDVNKEYAELWMGTHPNAPSVVKSTSQLLSDWITSHPESLGQGVRKEFGDKLPFLFKVLSVNKPLSVQAHPNKVKLPYIIYLPQKFKKQDMS